MGRGKSELEELEIERFAVSDTSLSEANAAIDRRQRALLIASAQKLDYGNASPFEINEIGIQLSGESGLRHLLTNEPLCPEARNFYRSLLRDLYLRSQVVDCYGDYLEATVAKVTGLPWHWTPLVVHEGGLYHLRNDESRATVCGLNADKFIQASPHGKFQQKLDQGLSCQRCYSIALNWTSEPEHPVVEAANEEHTPLLSAKEERAFEETLTERLRSNLAERVNDGEAFGQALQTERCYRRLDKVFASFIAEQFLALTPQQRLQQLLNGQRSQISDDLIVLRQLLSECYDSELPWPSQDELTEMCEQAMAQLWSFNAYQSQAELIAAITRFCWPDVDARFAALIAEKGIANRGLIASIYYDRD